MAFYDFHCEKCDKVHTLSFSMTDRAGRENAVCPDCGNKLKRIFFIVEELSFFMPSGLIVKEDNVVSPVKMNQTGDIKWAFADHRSKDLSKRSIGNKISGARFDEKTGRMVVDVISNTPDPLGKINKMNSQTQLKKINQKTKKRK